MNLINNRKIVIVEHLNNCWKKQNLSKQKSNFLSTKFCLIFWLFGFSVLKSCNFSYLQRITRVLIETLYLVVRACVLDVLEMSLFTCLNSVTMSNVICQIYVLFHYLLSLLASWSFRWVFSVHHSSAIFLEFVTSIFRVPVLQLVLRVNNTLLKFKCIWSDLTISRI